jgi:hypothetical protein
MDSASRQSTISLGESPKGQKQRLSSQDADTDQSTAGSASSRDSFDAGFALSALRHTVFSKVKASAKGLVRKSGSKLRPLFQKGSKLILKPRHFRKAPKALTENQQARRKRRRDNLSKLKRMIYRVDKDPFVASRVVLALAALCLLLRAGDLLLATTMSCLGVLILHQTTQLASTRPLEAWYYVGMASVVVSVGSYLTSLYVERNGISIPSSLWDRPQSPLWVWSRGVPRVWAIVLAGLLYQDIAASKDGDDNAIETIEVEVAILRIKAPPDSKIYRNYVVAPISIVIQKGPVVVGSMNTKALLGDAVRPGSNRFQTTAFSHFVESTKGSFLRILMKEGDTIKGSTDVAFPGVHCMKMSNWFHCADVELLIEIQSRPLAIHFLFRASTILPTIGCIALAAAFWK